MSNKDYGDIGEDAVVMYLEMTGYEIIARNWKTRWCEIDIIALKGKCLYFVESKFRARDVWGDGLDYITRKKLNKMKFAAEFWLANHQWSGECCLAAAAVDSYGDVDFIETLIF